MHEFALVEEILDAVKKEVKKHRDKKVKEISLELGKEMGIQAENLKFLLEESFRGTLEDLKIEIKVIPGRECIIKQIVFEQ